ncbi:MAG TPA: flagellar hook-length control protein FliK [Pseudolabrys sp.]
MADAKAPAGKKADANRKSDAKKDAKSDTDAKAADVVATTATPDAKDAKPADAATAAAVVTAVAQTQVAAETVAAAVPAAIEGAAGKPAGDATADATIAGAGKGKTGKAATGKIADGKAAEEAKAATAADAGKTDAEDQTGKAASSPEKVEKADANARGEAHAKENQAATIALADKPAFDPAQAAPAAGADATQTAAQTAALAAHTQQAGSATAATAAAAAAPAPLAQQTAAIPLSGVAFEITSKAQSSTNHFEIRLDPPELGHIEVRLDVDKDGNVTSNMIVDRPETLDLLRRDAAGLDRALQDAGLKTSNNGLQFQLRDQSGQQQQQGQNAPNTTRLVVQDENFTSAAIARDYGRLSGQSSGVDIHV